MQITRPLGSCLRIVCAYTNPNTLRTHYCGLHLQGSAQSVIIG